jgi:hypothetical protein
VFYSKINKLFSGQEYFYSRGRATSPPIYIVDFEWRNVVTQVEEIYKMKKKRCLKSRTYTLKVLG